jgi:AcrR family transcriptional regulator
MLPSPRRLPSSGNRRNPHAHKAIIDATLGQLKTVHYPDLTIESIAAAAGVGKATVYRWWPSKGALVAEAVSSTLIIEDPPETGDLHADLVAAAEISIRNYANPPGGILITALAADLAADPELLQSFISGFTLPRRAAVRELIQRAIDEGFFHRNLDPELVMDMWAGAVSYRALMKHIPASNELAAELVEVFMANPSTSRTT